MTEERINSYEIKYIPVSKLSVVWVRAQRPLNEKWASQIAEDFDPDKFEPICVTKPNGEGFYHIVEGQHRKAAVEKLWGSSEQVPCRIIAEADPARAAEIFLGINNGRKKIRSVIQFQVAVTAERPDEVAINKIIHRVGYRISDNKSSQGVVAAVGALKTVYLRYGDEVLKHTLEACKLFWGLDPAGVQSPMITGIGTFLNEWQSQVDILHLKKVIDSYSSPWKFLDAVRLNSEQMNETMPVAMAELIRHRYNRGMRVESKKLRRKEK